MAKNSLKSWLGWLVSIAATIMSLTVSWAMIAGALFIPKVPTWITVYSGWLLFLVTLLGLILAIIAKIKKSL